MVQSSRIPPLAIRLAIPVDPGPVSGSDDTLRHTVAISATFPITNLMPIGSFTLLNSKVAAISDDQPPTDNAVSERSTTILVHKSVHKLRFGSHPLRDAQTCRELSARVNDVRRFRQHATTHKFTREHFDARGGSLSHETVRRQYRRR